MIWLKNLVENDEFSFINSQICREKQKPNGNLCGALNEMLENELKRYDNLRVPTLLCEQQQQ